MKMKSREAKNKDKKMKMIKTWIQSMSHQIASTKF